MGLRDKIMGLTAKKTEAINATLQAQERLCNIIYNHYLPLNDDRLESRTGELWKVKVSKIDKYRVQIDLDQRWWIFRRGYSVDAYSQADRNISVHSQGNKTQRCAKFEEAVAAIDDAIAHFLARH